MSLVLSVLLALLAAGGGVVGERERIAVRVSSLVEEHAKNVQDSLYGCAECEFPPAEKVEADGRVWRVRHYFDTPKRRMRYLAWATGFETDSIRLCGLAIEWGPGDTEFWIPKACEGAAPASRR